MSQNSQQPVIFQQTFQVFTNHFQFYLEDEHAALDSTTIWTKEAMHNNLAYDPKSRDGFAVGTARDMTAPVTIEIRSAAPDDESFEKWDRVNECSIEIKSGKMLLINTTGSHADAPRIDMRPGVYRARIYYAGLDALEYDPDGGDHYKIVLWPDVWREPRIIKPEAAASD